MALITRESKGSKLTFQEMDGNLLYLEGLSGNTGSSGTSGVDGTSGIDGILPGVGTNSELVIRDTGATYGYNTIPLVHSVMRSYGSETNEPTGFKNRNDSSSVISFDDSNRTFTISTSSSYIIYNKGIKYIMTGSTSVQINDVSRSYFIFFDENGNLNYYYDFNLYKFNQTLISVVRWDSTLQKAIVLLDERHGIVMDQSTHYYLHTVIGMSYISGINLTGFTIGDGSDNLHCKFLTTAGSVIDEDVIHIIDDKNSLTSSLYKNLYLTGTSIFINFWHYLHSEFPILHNENGILYNFKSGNTWILNNVTDNNYVLLHVLASNDILTGTTGENHNLHFIVGHNEYDSISGATNNMATELKAIKALAVTPEYAPIATIIYQSSSSFTNTVKARIVPNSNGDNFKDWRGHSFGTLGMKFIV